MTNYSQMESKHLSFLQFLWVRDSETVYLSSSGFAVSNEVAIKVLVWLQSPEGLTGNKGFTTKWAHSHHWQVSAGYWQKALISCYMNLLIGLLECPHVMAVGFSQTECSKTRQEGSCDLFCDLALEVT